MPCTDPRTVGFMADGKTISWSQKNYSKEYAAFQLPCGQCLECRLSYARQWAIRCVHEAQMHEKNAFITLTYDNENLKSPQLIYRDFQLFMKKLRFLHNDPIGVFVTGEYGAENKRPHWHCLTFGYAPPDGVREPNQTDRRDDDVTYTSAQLDKLWGKGKANFGSVTINSAGYCARYAAKKLVHGKDGEHEFEPISKKSSKHAIGKRWIEQYWPDVFRYGRVVLADGTEAPIPRYYEKWLKDHRPNDWLAYVTRVKLERQLSASKREKSEEQKWWDTYNARRLTSKTPLRRNEVRRLLKAKQFEQLEAYLKL